MDWLWPKITNSQEAEKAVLHSAMWATFVAVLTCIVAVVAILSGHPISGIDGTALFDGILFAAIAWRLYRLSFGWAVFSVVMMTLEILWKTVDGHLSVLSFIILAGFVSGVRGTFFLRGRRHKDEIIASQVAEVRKFLRLDEEMPPWFGETQTWLDKRVSEELSMFDRATEYKAFLLERVRYLYLASKSIDDFVTTCKVSAVALEFKAMLMLTGMERKSEPAAMLGIAYSVLPECRPFFSFEQVVSDAVEIRVLGKMQLLEAEMMGVLYTFLAKNDGIWFRESVDSMERAAKLYWDEGILPDFMYFNTKKDAAGKTTEPTGEVPAVAD